MGKVLDADGSAADAYAQVDLGSEIAEVWVTFDVFFTAATKTAWAEVAAAYLCELLDSGSVLLNGVYVENDWQGPYDATNDVWLTDGDADADLWQTVELHQADDGTTGLYVAGMLVSSSATGSLSGVQFVRVGHDQAGDTDPAFIVYFDNVKIGTTRGGTELFSDDFEDGTLDAWTTTSGDVSVIDNPYPSPELSIKVAKGLVPGAFVEKTVAPSTGSAGRKRFTIGGDAQAVTVRLEQTEPSSETTIFALEVVLRPYDTGSEIG